MSDSVQLIPLEIHKNGRRGNIVVVENPPFKIKRVFAIYDVPVNEIRGGHAHKTCRQLLVATSGAVLVKIAGGADYVLDAPEIGLYVPPRHILHLKFLTEGAVLMVVASEKFNKDDYIYSEVE